MRSQTISSRLFSDFEYCDTACIVVAILSKHAFQQYVDLVHAWRQRQQPVQALEQQNMDLSRKNHKTLNNKHSRHRKWVKLCGPFTSALARKSGPFTADRISSYNIV
jgi:hypothetical protein